MNKIYLILLVLVFLSSCIPDEDPVQPYDRGDVISSEISLGTFYEEQVYYSLDNDAVVKANKLTDWDLAFSCSDSGFVIITNFAQFMSVAIVEEISFENFEKDDVDNIPDDAWNYDNPEGKLDSTAIGKWWYEENGEIVSLQKVYIIDRGTDEIGKKLGFYKFQVTDYKEETYTIRFGNVKKSEEYVVQVKKDELYNFVHLSFDEEGKVLTLEPPKPDWDLLFTRYTELLYTSEGDAMWYSVVGAYLNPYNDTEAAILYSDDFPSVSADAIDTLSFKSYRNAVGHDWKYYDLDAGAYIVKSQIVFMIKNVTGFYYKLHFVDFYDLLGNKGTPTFEFQKL